MTHGKTYNKSLRRINHKATKSKTSTGTTALQRSVEQTTGGFKALLQLANFTLGPDATQLINFCSKETNTAAFITYTNCAKLYFLTNFDDWKTKVY